MMFATFLGVSTAKQELFSCADIVIFGARDATPHVPGAPVVQPAHPPLFGTARDISPKIPPPWDFDQDGPLLPSQLQIVDFGDLPTDPATPEENRSLITSTVVSILKAGAVPLLLGGDDSVPIPFFAGREVRARHRAADRCAS